MKCCLLTYRGRYLDDFKEKVIVSKQPRTSVLLLPLIIVALILSACGGGQPNPEPQPIAAPVQASERMYADFDPVDADCVMPLTKQQLDELDDYIEDNGNPYGSRVKEVCVLEQDKTGAYVQHYYSAADQGLFERVYPQHDRSDLGTWVLYTMLFGHSKQVLNFGLVTGQLSLLDYVFLNSFYGVDRSGYMYRPYSGSGSSWRGHRMDTGKSIKQVRYGALKPLPYQQGIMNPAPGYSKPSPLLTQPKTTSAPKQTLGLSTPKPASRPTSNAGSGSGYTKPQDGGSTVKRGGFGGSGGSGGSKPGGGSKPRK